jgi:hypothetical protein
VRCGRQGANLQLRLARIHAPVDTRRPHQVPGIHGLRVEAAADAQALRSRSDFLDLQANPPPRTPAPAYGCG